MVKTHSSKLPIRLAVILFVLLMSHLAATPAVAAEYYVSPTGSSRNSGSIDSPLDLATALSSASPARPGDTIWLRGGRYLGNFASNLVGTPAAPIIVRQYPGERATIDADTSQRNAAGLAVYGADTWFWGFEITDSNPVRVVPGVYNPPRATSVWVLAPRTKFINLIVHEGEQGFGFWSAAVDSEMYGNVIYNTGFDSDARGNGHAVYVQNTTGTKRIVDNIMFNGFSFGIHAYTQNGKIDNIHMIGNTIFNEGILSRGGPKVNLFMGGGDPVGPVIQENYLYHSPFNSSGRNIELRPSCLNGRITNNYSAGGTAMSIYCISTTVTGNFFAGRTASDVAYPNNTIQSTQPTGVAVFVRPNQYERGARANVTIFNWDLRSHVTVDVSAAGFPVGSRYELRDAQNYFGAPVVTGTYDGNPISVPMLGLSVARPVGNVPVIPAHTAPQFGAFVLVRTSTSTPPTLTATLSVAPATINAGQSALLTWSTSNATQVTINNGVGVAPASGTASVSPTTTTTYVLTAGNATSTLTKSATVTVNTNTPPPIPPPPGPGTVTTAKFVKLDTTTQGDWKGVYGGEGYSVAEDGVQSPGYAKVAMTGTSPWVWAANTSAKPALQRVTGTGRIESAWYNSGEFTIDVTTTDAQSHQVALYMLDGGNGNRTQRIDVLDLTTQAVLDTRTATGFSQGQYFVWQISGAVRFRITRVGPFNAVTSGIFFGASAGTAGANRPPAISLASTGTTFTAPASIPLTATASDGDGSVTRVRFYSGPTLLATDATNTYSHVWTNVPAGKYNVTAQATDNGGATTTSTAVTITVSPAPGRPGARAAFLRADATTQGNWRNVYGSDGYSLANERASLPEYATFAPSGTSTYTWSADDTAARSLQRPVGNGRFAATWYNSTFAMDVAITDGQTRQVALYVVDWDQNGRTQTIEVVDSATDIVLDRRTVSAFSGGQYLIWQVAGSVRFRLSRVSGVNAVVSGVFFDGAQHVAFLRTDTTTQGTWKGAYGNDGYLLALDASKQPSYGQVTISGAAPYSWSSNETATRALQRASGSGRQATTLYSDSGIVIDIAVTDGQTHKLALYAIDWDKRGRSQTIEVVDPMNGAVLDIQNMNDFSEGQYLVWQIKGRLRIRIVRPTAINAVLSGVFFGAP